MREDLSLVSREIVDILRDGGIGILRTDTLYGMVACANNEQEVEHIHSLKYRDALKSPIGSLAISGSRTADCLSSMRIFSRVAGHRGQRSYYQVIRHHFGCDRLMDQCRIM